MNHRRSVDNCNDVKTGGSTTSRDQSDGSLDVGLTASGIEMARPSVNARIFDRFGGGGIIKNGACVHQCRQFFTCSVTFCFSFFDKSTKSDIPHD